MKKYILIISLACAHSLTVEAMLKEFNPNDDAQKQEKLKHLTERKKRELRTSDEESENCCCAFLNCCITHFANLPPQPTFCQTKVSYYLQE